jgi:ferric-dicitrate binding protein FerR (iron transport regulator)
MTSFSSPHQQLSAQDLDRLLAQLDEPTSDPGAGEPSESFTANPTAVAAWHALRTGREEAVAHVRSGDQGDRLQRLQQALRRETAVRRPAHSTRLPRHWYRVALTSAGASLLAGASMFVLLGRGEAPRVVRTYQTLAARHMPVELPDGSHALLGPATTLRVESSAEGTALDIRVDGQARFVVTPRTRHAFLVRTPNALVRVIGTTFVVRRYATDGITRVAVTEGRVALSGVRAGLTNPSLTLAAGMVGMITDSGTTRTTSNSTIDTDTAWVSGRLVFRKAPVRDIVIDLGRAYGANIQVRDSALAARRLTWIVPIAEKSLADALEAIALVLDARVTKSGGVITIVQGRANERLSSPSSIPHKPESQYGK